MRRLQMLILVLLLLFPSAALAERTVYADQGGVAVFMEGGKVGLMDSQGNVILPAEYDWIEPFGGDDYAIVCRDGFKGIVRRDGTFIVPCGIDYFDRLGNAGLAEVEYKDDDRSYLIELKTGRVLHEGKGYSYTMKGSFIRAMQYGLWDVDYTEMLDLDGSVLFATEGAVYEFAEDLAVVVDSGMNASLVDLQGNVLLKGMRNSLHISEGKAFYNWPEETPEGERWHCGIWRKDGAQTELVADSYTRFESYSAPYCVKTEDGDRVGYVDDDCRWVIPPVYSEGYPFADGTAVVCADGKYRLIDEQGNQVGQTEWTWEDWNSLFAMFTGDTTLMTLPVLPINVDGVTRLIDRRGNYVNDETILPESNSHSNIDDRRLILRDSEGKLCIVDGQDGRVLLRVEADDWEAWYSRGIYSLWLSVDGLLGLIDYSGENASRWIIEPCAKEVDLLYSENGFWALLPDETTVFFDHQGRIVGPGWEYHPEKDW